MVKGTTPGYTFELPFDSSAIANCQIVFSQDETVIIKNKDECTITDKTVGTTLTQEETFKFDENKYLEIQLRVLTPTGDALATEPTKVPVIKCLTEEVLA